MEVKQEPLDCLKQEPIDQFIPSLKQEHRDQFSSMKQEHRDFLPSLCGGQEDWLSDELPDLADIEVKPLGEEDASSPASCGATCSGGQQGGLSSQPPPPPQPPPSCNRYSESCGGQTPQHTMWPGHQQHFGHHFVPLTQININGLPQQGISIQQSIQVHHPVQYQGHHFPPSMTMYHGQMAPPMEPQYNMQRSNKPPEKIFPKPIYSYSCLIALSLKNSKSGSLPVSGIYNFMIEHFPYFKTAPDGWKNSVRHNLSLNKCFEKIDNPNKTNSNSKKGCLWALNPTKAVKMDDEVVKCRKRDPMAVKRSMLKPEFLQSLEKGWLKSEDDYQTPGKAIPSDPNKVEKLISAQSNPYEEDEFTTRRHQSPFLQQECGGNGSGSDGDAQHSPGSDLSADQLTPSLGLDDMGSLSHLESGADLTSEDFQLLGHLSSSPCFGNFNRNSDLSSPPAKLLALSSESVSMSLTLPDDCLTP